MRSRPVTAYRFFENYFLPLTEQPIYFFCFAGMEATSPVVKALPFLQDPALEKEVMEQASFMEVEADDVIVRVG